uniref:Spermidine/putrescine transport system permease protein n=1 Tax=Candidatus Kentrum sp. FM TaxID=2126340 RepID=A0A450SCR4_9GAMM|nr:MAG: hypothetical protein BECKFM1743A_GA0114220_100547 [Candidatus Kentron sp. FM]VFJ50246.1 MAG: hypothetical protein BECKFM1743C_GA0114222_100827 [Candidatus Kentron sp. FM]VFK08525.1 MAG: hypothetical protein BECKFM1743B_GA0114221_100737 [Candidatus Kentron sp. FM]
MVLYVARRAVPQDHILAAKDLGASWYRIQYAIVIRLYRKCSGRLFRSTGCGSPRWVSNNDYLSMRPGIIVALILPFIVFLEDVTVTDPIGGSQVYTATAMILNFVKIDDWGSAAVGVFLLLVTITVISAVGAMILRKA